MLNSLLWILLDLHRVSAQTWMEDVLRGSAAVTKYSQSELNAKAVSRSLPRFTVASKLPLAVSHRRRTRSLSTKVSVTPHPDVRVILTPLPSEARILSSGL